MVDLINRSKPKEMFRNDQDYRILHRTTMQTCLDVGNNSSDIPYPLVIEERKVKNVSQAISSQKSLHIH